MDFKFGWITEDSSKLLFVYFDGQFDCCGYEGEEERGYENYYDPLTEKDPASKIPNR